MELRLRFCPMMSALVVLGRIWCRLVSPSIRGMWAPFTKARRDKQRMTHRWRNVLSPEKHWKAQTRTRLTFGMTEETTQQLQKRIINCYSPRNWQSKPPNPTSSKRNGRHLYRTTRANPHLPPLTTRQHLTFKSPRPNPTSMQLVNLSTNCIPYPIRKWPDQW